MSTKDTGPLFADECYRHEVHDAIGSRTRLEIVLESLKDDGLWKLLGEGKATLEDQRYAAGWIATLTLEIEKLEDQKAM